MYQIKLNSFEKFTYKFGKLDMFHTIVSSDVFDFLTGRMPPYIVNQIFKENKMQCKMYFNR